MEVLFCHNPCVKSYFEFVHGSYQSSLYSENNLFICVEDELTPKFKQLFDSIYLQNKMILLTSDNTLPELKIIDYQIISRYNNIKHQSRL